MFRSTDGGQGWEKVNNGLSALYESCLAINADGDIFLGADFVNGAGGVFRSTDNWARLAEINHDVIETDVRASQRSIQPAKLFAGNSRGCEDGVYRSTDNGDSWTLANTGLTSTDIAGLGINNNGHIFAATRSIMGEGGGMFRSTDNGDS